MIYHMIAHSYRMLVMSSSMCLINFICLRYIYSGRDIIRFQSFGYEEIYEPSALFYIFNFGNVCLLKSHLNEKLSEHGLLPN